MKKSNTVLIALTVLSAVFFVWALVRSGAQVSPATQNAVGENSSAASQVLEEKINDEGGVEVSVRLLDVKSNEWAFQITLNTHSGDLTDDMASVSTLEDKNGKTYPPLAWEGDPPGGHHRQGTLRFTPMSPKPDPLVLVIRGVGGVDERQFTWTTTE